MRTLTATEQLQIWERGIRQTPARRALLLLAAAMPETAPADLAKFSVGQRDAQLLTLRERMFGSRIESLAACPECAESLELTFAVTDIRLINEAESMPNGATYMFSLDGYDIRFRLPNSTDLEAISNCQSLAAAHERLLERCTLEIKCRKAKSKSLERPDRLPPKVSAALIRKMAELDPQANIQLSLSCPACRHGWSVVFDIGSFLWSEIKDLGERLLREIHVIAYTYGWREADILEMSAERRNFYLEMIGGA